MNLRLVLKSQGGLLRMHHIGTGCLLQGRDTCGPASCTFEGVERVVRASGATAFSFETQYLDAQLA